MREFFRDKRNISIGVILLICLYFPLSESIPMWSKHPVRVECSRKTTKCSVIEYSYEHKICWSTMFRRRHYRRYCHIPKYVESEKEIFKLYDISSAEVKDMGGYSVVYLKSIDGKTADVKKYKERDRAEHFRTLFNNSLSGWRKYADESLSIDPYSGSHTFDFPAD